MGTEPNNWKQITPFTTYNYWLLLTLEHLYTTYLLPHAFVPLCTHSRTATRAHTPLHPFTSYHKHSHIGARQYQPHVHLHTTTGTYLFPNMTVQNLAILPRSKHLYDFEHICIPSYTLGYCKKISENPFIRTNTTVLKVFLSRSETRTAIIQMYRRGYEQSNTSLRVFYARKEFRSGD